MPKREKVLWASLWAVTSVLIILQIILGFVYYSETDNQVLRYLGWGIFALSAYFGWQQIITLRKRGKVAKGKSYVHTTILVDTGIYAIIRHPQYFAFILINLAIILIAQYRLITAIGIISIILSYLIILEEDQSCLKKFGKDYEQYMENVPMINIFSGTIRFLKRKLLL